jgi:hypothetical protein
LFEFLLSDRLGHLVQHLVRAGALRLSLAVS